MTGFQQPAAAQSRPPATGLAGEITTHVLDVIHHAMKAHPRSQQTAPGPSELGTPCTRRLAYKIADWDRPNDDRDQWLSTIGTATHAWLAATFEAENARQVEQSQCASCLHLYGARCGCGCCQPARIRPRYLVEHRVHLPGGISGSCDLFDRDMHLVNDWKVSGTDRIKQYRRSGPGDTYRKQAHLYGLGMLIAGETVTDVAITFLPRGGLLAPGIYVWTEPFDAQLAVDTLRRYEQTRAGVITLDPEASPAMWAMFPTAEAHCTWCPYHLPRSTDLGKGCPGHRTNPPNTK